MLGHLLSQPLPIPLQQLDLLLQGVNLTSHCGLSQWGVAGSGRTQLELHSGNQLLNIDGLWRHSRYDNGVVVSNQWCFWIDHWQPIGLTLLLFEAHRCFTDNLKVKLYTRIPLVIERIITK